MDNGGYDESVPIGKSRQRTLYSTAILVSSIAAGGCYLAGMGSKENPNNVPTNTFVGQSVFEDSLGLEQICDFVFSHYKAPTYIGQIPDRVKQVSCRPLKKSK